MTRYAAVLLCLLFAGTLVVSTGARSADPRLNNSFRREEQNGWIYVHLEGSPRELGFQHGYWLEPEILATFQAASRLAEHDSRRPWAFFRETAEKVLWPHVEQQYREELQGVAEGIKARGGSLDLWDIVAHNAMEELSGYYVPWLNKQQAAGVKTRGAPESCSAFVATGSYTRDGRIVIGHNNWTDYATGRNWNVVFDMAPAFGYHIFMDGIPGIIASDDDFGINSAGLIITETTISQFEGFEPKGIPEFVRARKAMQYAASIDDFDRIMREGNNGGYANAWLLADRKTNEIARLELGLKNVNLERTKDGYFVGANFPVSERLAREETPGYDMKDPSISGNARRARWEQLMAEYRGKIDLAVGQKFLSDHYDTFTRSQDPSQRTLCGHVDLSREGMRPWQPPFGPAGTVQNKVTDAAMAERMSFTAAMGHACGLHFKAEEHLRRHPEFSWQKGILRDLDSYPWTTFSAARK
ncbi:MAG: peptidase C45 [Acidobacteria bacterium]|nr:peptidase C45 [Acidobacteriota bacterium]